LPNAAEDVAKLLQSGQSGGLAAERGWER